MIVFAQLAPIVLDFSGLGQILVNALVDGMRALVSPLPVDFEQWVLHGIQGIISSQHEFNLLTQIPVSWTTQDRDVSDLIKNSWPWIGGLFAIVVLIQGFRVMNSRIDFWEAAPRTVFFAMVGGGMLFFADKLIIIINDLSSMVGTSPIDITSSSLPGGLELGIMLIVAAVFALLAWIKGAVGIIFIKVLLVTAPFVFILSALPIIDALGRWWIEEFTTWLLRPFFVAITLRLGLGLAATEGGPIGLLFVLVTFWLAYTMDTRIRRFSVGAWGSVGQMGTFARFARMAGAAASGGAAAGAAASSGSGAAASGAAAAATP